MIILSNLKGTIKILAKNKLKKTFFFPFQICFWLQYLQQYEMNKVFLQTSLEENFLNFSYIYILSVNFENLTVEFHVPYVLNIHMKFGSNWILFTIWSINLFFIYNFRLQKLEIIIFIWWHSNWSLIFLKFCKHFRCNKIMQSNG